MNCRHFLLLISNQTLHFDNSKCESLWLKLQVTTLHCWFSCRTVALLQRSLSMTVKCVFLPRLSVVPLSAGSRCYLPRSCTHPTSHTSQIAARVQCAVGFIDYNPKVGIWNKKFKHKENRKTLLKYRWSCWFQTNLWQKRFKLCRNIWAFPLHSCLYHFPKLLHEKWATET